MGKAELDRIVTDFKTAVHGLAEKFVLQELEETKARMYAAVSGEMSAALGRKSNKANWPTNYSGPPARGELAALVDGLAARAPASARRRSRRSPTLHVPDGVAAPAALPESPEPTTRRWQIIKADMQHAGARSIQTIRSVASYDSRARFASQGSCATWVSEMISQGFMVRVGRGVFMLAPRFQDADTAAQGTGA